MADVSNRQRAGFVLGIVVGVLNLATGFASPSGSEAGPPLFIVLLGVGAGVVIIALLVLGWRTGKALPTRIAAVLIVVNALTAAPAFGVEDVPEWVQIYAGVLILASVAAVVLLFSAGRTVPADA